ncbi:MAG TPA: FGGY family carbohydrate kinase [Sphaerochaeta sp.]|jgi:sedoheptulokinase|nr:FGGY family carbohydrate kinase [Sphaerochaeta sp.]
MAPLYVGIDIGTTNITITALDLAARKVPSSRSLPNRRVPSSDPYAYLQDPIAIEDSVRQLLAGVTDPIAAICVTGQVHGIVYYDSDGVACSPLYTWLDQRAMEVFDNMSSQQALYEQTGYLLPSGYGLLAHYANRRLGKIVREAVGFCGIIEYITARLVGTPLFAADPSCLGTYGGFDPVTSTFDHTLLSEVFGTSSYTFLEASQPFEIAGQTPEGVAVIHGVGDNQAGFFGMVSSWQRSALISIGTSGQISLFSKRSECPPSMELRPFLGEGYLHVGATLTAGKAYETLQRLFASTIRGVGFEITDEAVFDMMKEQAGQLSTSTLLVDPRLTGSRKDPAVRGSITNIGLDNLDIGSLVLGTIDGIVAELKAFGLEAEQIFSPIESIVATGSAVRKNPLFRASLARMFSLPAIVADVDDGAGFGAALIAATSVGALDLAKREELVHTVLGT